MGKKKKTNLGKYFGLPKPKWRGPKFVSTKCFLNACHAHIVSDKGYILTSDLKSFLDQMFAEARREPDVDFNMMTKFTRDHIFFFENKNQKWISLLELYESLSVIEHNFLLNYRGRVKYSSVDIMQIWSHYCQDNAISLTEHDIQVLAFDLLSKTEHKCNPKVIKLLVDNMLTLSETDGELTLSGLSKLLPMEESILKQYKSLNNLEERDFDRIYAFYDQDDEGQINGCELDAFIKDVLEFNGQENPYDMKLIKESRSYLQQEGAITKLGNFEKSFINVLFTLGSKQTAL